MAQLRKQVIMYAVLNRFDTTATRNIAKALLLTAVCIVGIVATYYAAAIIVPVIVAAIVAAASFVAHVVAVVVGALVHAALFAVAMLLRAAVLVALCWLFAHMPRVSWHAVAVATKGLALCTVVVGCFVVALVYGPVIWAALPTVGTVAGVFGGFIAAGKVM